MSSPPATHRARWLAVPAALLLSAVLLPSAGAQVPDETPGRATALVADAFGVEVDATAAGQGIVDSGPVPEVSVAMPPQQETQATSAGDLGPVPDDGSLIEQLTLETVTAGGDLADGVAQATSQVSDIELLNAGLVPAALVSADMVRAVSTSTCTLPGTLEEASDGTSFVGLEIAGAPVPADVAPNTEIDIPGVARVVVNEVIPDSDNIGFTVRGLHVFTVDPLTGSVGAELIVAEAHSNVACADGPMAPNPDDLLAQDLRIDKAVADGQDITERQPGDTVTYDISVTNQTDGTCTVSEVRDTLPEGFAYVEGSATGDLAAEAATATVDGRDVVFDYQPDGLPVEGGQTLAGSFDVRIGRDVAPGTYFDDAQVRSTCSTARTGPTAGVAIPSPESPGEGKVERIDGAGRIDTAIEVSQVAFPDGADVVLLARSDIYADSLSGAPLAAGRNGPILYSSTDELTEATALEIDRLDPEQVILLGLTAALSADVEQDVQDRGFDTLRLGGENRFGTSVEVADELGSTSGTVFIAEGGAPTPDRGWPDAVSAAPYAAFRGDPILLVVQGDLPDETEAALDARQVTESVVVGGPSAVGDGVFDELETRGEGPRRLFGATRYQTSEAVYTESIAAGLDPGVLWLAKGTDWPDALVIGPAAAALGQSFMLVDPADLNDSPPTRSVVERQREVINTVRIGGGTATIAQQVEDQIEAILE